MTKARTKNTRIPKTTNCAKGKPGKAVKCSESDQSEDDEFRTIAAVEFEAAPIDLSAGMTNDELGALMVSVRTAACFLTMSKSELVDAIGKIDAGKEFVDGSDAIVLLEHLTAVRDKFKGLGEFCDEALRRALIAIYAVVETADQSKASGKRAA